jgi:tellurite resistance protein TehA-like permease
MLPLIGVLTSATNGGLTINFSPVTVRMAVPVIITGYLYLGMGFFLAFTILPNFVYRNLTHGFSKDSMHSPAEILLIGPPGQAAAGFLGLGLAAQRDFGQYAKGTFLQSSAGMGLYSASVMLALLLLGLSFILGLMTFVRLAENVRLWKFSLAWWASIFPFGDFLFLN